MEGNRLGWLVLAREFTIFALFYFVFEGKFQVQAPRGREGLHSEGRFNGGIFRYDFGGLYLEGLIFGILRYLGKFMTKSIKLNLYSEFNLTIIDPCKILREIENKPVQFLSCFTSRITWYDLV